MNYNTRDDTRTGEEIFKEYLSSFWPVYKQKVQKEPIQERKEFISNYVMPYTQEDFTHASAAFQQIYSRRLLLVGSGARMGFYNTEKTAVLKVQDTVLRSLTQKAFQLDRGQYVKIFPNAYVEARFIGELFREKDYPDWEDPSIKSWETILFVYEPLNKIFQTTYYDYVNSCHFSLLKMKRNININSEMIEQTAFSLNES